MMDAIQPQVEIKVNPRLLVCTAQRGTLQPMVTTLGSAILDALERLQKTQFWLAEEVGVSPQAVTKWIQTGKINRENAVQVAHVLGISIDTLIGGPRSNQQQIGQAIEALSDEHQQQVLDFIQYKIEKSETFMSQERAARYLKMIDDIKTDMARRAAGNEGPAPGNPKQKK